MRGGENERGEKGKRKGFREERKIIFKKKRKTTFVLTLLVGLRPFQLQETLECHAAHARQFYDWVSRS